MALARHSLQHWTARFRFSLSAARALQKQLQDNINDDAHDDAGPGLYVPPIGPRDERRKAKSISTPNNRKVNFVNAILDRWKRRATEPLSLAPKNTNPAETQRSAETCAAAKRRLYGYSRSKDEVARCCAT